MSSTSASTSNPPNRAQRQKCWLVRDDYFACLDSCGVIDPATVDTKPDVREKAKTCLEKKKKYEAECIASWVSYFNKRRVAAFRQEEYFKLAKAQNESLRK
ncbi:cytochrome oxidase c subunit VIb-domain-containing protein [Endogone sp. FLAS-F59071]|nr:cytochrome oxidase c subunit VIb-domain-containing protein [Endogone sp. FLAS-F59071]|eukprot:RUS18501.1 cytochrome oxidase c subunit VIb-domain-containing protein [Endogone sp. FLAS-F59071]